MIVTERKRWISAHPPTFLERVKPRESSDADGCAVCGAEARTLHIHSTPDLCVRVCKTHHAHIREEFIAFRRIMRKLGRECRYSVAEWEAISS